MDSIESGSTSEGHEADSCLYSVVIPVYGNEGSIPPLLRRLQEVSTALDGALEAVFVIDGSPDRSAELLLAALPAQSHPSQLITHSRNFGSFAAVKTGLARARGGLIAVMAADLQEPPELLLEFFQTLNTGDVDLVVGARKGRTDPGLSVTASRVFWAVYRRFVQPEIPRGGVDVFACTERFKRHLVNLDEANSSLVALTYWLGFKRAEVPYERQPRSHGHSAWTLRRKLRYLSDSVYSFTDLPIRMLLAAGTIGVTVSISLAIIVGIARLSGAIAIPGYAATIMVITFFAALNLAGLGIIGAYVWRAFENTKDRPGAIVMAARSFEPADSRARR
jgi:glycosyltransferase involved in cell wall biosynthesis